MSEIVITGATGVLGRRVVEQLVIAGHGVTAVVRSESSARKARERGARPVIADVYDRDALTAAFAGADAVVNLLTRIPPAARMGDPGAWEENDRLRTEASAAIAEAAQAAGVDRLVQESLAFVYADGGDAWLDEDAPVVGGGTTDTALVAERNATERFGGDTVVLRFALFVGPDSDLTLTDVMNARAGLSPSVGRRDAYRATVWLDDAASAVVAALDAPAGTYNVADADPATRGEGDAALAAAVGRDTLDPVFADDAIPPRMEPLARSQRLSTRRLTEATGWTPRVRAATEGWELVVGVPA